MKRMAIGLLAALSAACTAAGPNNADEAGGEARITNAAQPPDCPEEELSCVRQRPVVSDGSAPFLNANYGLTMVFPRGDRVCMTRSGNAPHGFVAHYGDGTGCPERPEQGPRFIALYAEFNALFYTTLAQALPARCRPVSSATARRLRGVSLAFPGFPSTVCETPARPGAIELSVYTLAGPWQQGERPGSRVRKAVYYITLGTADAHFDEDLARFREVLASIRIDSG